MKRKDVTTRSHSAKAATLAPRPALGNAAKPVPSSTPTVLAFKKILVPVDFSSFSYRALGYAVPLAVQFGASIVLLHVVEPQIHQESLIVGPDLEEINVKEMRLSREKIDELAQERIGHTVSSQTSVRIGKPYLEIVAAAHELAVDLIVIATHGYTGLKHVFLGSNAERVVRLAPCPVLTVQEKETDSPEI